MHEAAFTSRPSRRISYFQTREPTEREIEIFLVTIELGDKGAAERFGISFQTVKNHMANLREKLQANNRSHVAWLLWPKYGEVLSKLDFAYDKNKWGRLYGPNNRRMGRDRRNGA
jgi:DNA-binding CsgD family transcriptional regulator